MRAGAGSGLRAAGWAAVAGLLLLVSACAARAGGTTPTPTTPAASDRLVLQLRYVGGFLPIGVTDAFPPVVSVYADGRVITQGPVPAIHPGPALPNLQVQRIGTDDVGILVERALAAGVRDTADLGRPPVMDAATTRFTVVAGEHTYVRDVYALTGPARNGTGGVDPSQQAAREKLLDLDRALTDLEGTLGTGHLSAAEPYTADAVAAVVATVRPLPEDLPQPEMPWPGPALPGEALAGQQGVTCVSASGAEATTVLRAAQQANALTPWTTADGGRWWVTFRPLLPDESSCADLAD